MTSKYDALKRDPDVKRWHRNLERRSPDTADSYFQALAVFLGRSRQDAKAFAELPQKQLDNLVGDYIADLEDLGKSRSSMNTAKCALQSWLQWQGKKLERPIHLPKNRTPGRASRAQIPDQDGLRRILDAADARARATIAFLAQAGVRPGVLGNQRGTDGLRLRDLPEAKLTANGLEFIKVPTRIQVPAQLNKVNHAYFTFLGPEGCDYLAASIQERIQSGESITPDSAVTRPKVGAFAKSDSISDLVRKPIRAAGMTQYPYILRSYFGNRCLMAQSKGLLHDYKEFFMGHKGSISAVYALNKEVPHDTVEAMRHAYTQAQEFLETRVTGNRKDPILDFVNLLLQSKGLAAEQVAAMDLAAKSTDEIVALLAEAETQAKGRQRLVRPEELGQAIGEGWIVKCQLTDGRIVLEA